VENVHHLHIWQLDENRNTLESHIVLKENADIYQVKKALKQMLHDQFEIEHSTLEMEYLLCE
tara:strand:- start:673 stop:858 length:186 start_codon:yes stop_codon:yes gene_type:complete